MIQVSEVSEGLRWSKLRVTRLRQRMSSLSLLHRIVIANTMIIILGAAAGTVLTVHLASRVGELGLILAFVSAGVLLSFFSNLLLVRAALKPLNQLRDRARAVASGSDRAGPDVTPSADRDVRQLAQALGDLVQQLEDRNRELRALSHLAIRSQEAERKRIARSLHDDTSQYLSMLVVKLERLEQRFPVEAVEQHDQVVSCRVLAQQTVQELRKIIHGLRPTLLDDLGLLPAIRWYSRSLLEEAGVRVIFNSPAVSPPLTDQTSEALFRIAQEAIANVVQHAGARQATIDLRVSDRNVRLLVADDGCGFDPATIGEHRLGLLGMSERASLVGGRLELDSAPGHGTRLSVQVPLTTSGDSDDDQD